MSSLLFRQFCVPRRWNVCWRSSGYAAGLASSVTPHGQQFTRNKHYASMEPSPERQLRNPLKNLKPLADQIRGRPGAVDAAMKDIGYAFRTLVDVQFRISRRGQPDGTVPEWNIDVLQDLVNSLSKSRVLALHAPAIHSILRFASAERSLDVSELIRNIDGDLPILCEKALPHQMYHLVCGLAYFHRRSRVKLMLKELYSRKTISDMSPNQAVMMLKAFVSSGIELSYGDVERLGVFLNEKGMAAVSAQTLASYARLLLSSGQELCTVVDLAGELLARAGDRADTLLGRHDWLQVLLVLRRSDKLSADVLEAVEKYFLPEANHNQCLQLLRLLFFADASSHVEKAAIATVKTIVPHLSCLTAQECCMLVRQVSRWSYDDYPAVFDMMQQAAKSPITTEALVDLLYGLKVVKMPCNRNVKPVLLSLVQRNTVSRQELKELHVRTAVQLCLACTHFNLRVDDWMATLAAFLEDHVHDVAAYSQTGLVQMLDAFAHLGYPIPRKVCRQLPDVLHGEQLVLDGIRMLRSVWLCGDMAVFPQLCAAYKLHEPSRFALVMQKSVFPAMDYQQISAGNQKYNQDLPKLPEDILLPLALDVIRFRSGARWIQRYVADVSQALGPARVQRLVASEGGNVCDVALLVDSAGSLLDWEPEYVLAVQGVPVVQSAVLPRDAVPVAVCIGLVSEHCMASDSVVLNSRVTGRAHSFRMEGWQSVVVDIPAARAGVDFLLSAVSRSDDL